MTRKEWMLEHHPENVGDDFLGGVYLCPYSYTDLCELDPKIYKLLNQGCDETQPNCADCWNTEIPNTKKETKMIDKKIDDNGNVLSIEAVPAPNELKPGLHPSDVSPHILDSGDRTEFESGAVRDMREGKGRCDLLPLGVVSRLFNNKIFEYIEEFQCDGDVKHLYEAIDFFSYRWAPVEKGLAGGDLEMTSYAEMLLEVAKHFEEGAKKYGDDNWRKGIPAHVYIDSAVRHYLKFLAHWDDEPHDRAVAWNLMCCIWTCDNKPELNDYAAKKEVN